MTTEETALLTLCGVGLQFPAAVIIDLAARSRVAAIRRSGGHADDDEEFVSLYSRFTHT